MTLSSSSLSIQGRAREGRGGGEREREVDRRSVREVTGEIGDDITINRMSEKINKKISE
jgi:hypothetical protein